jgi:hypothetical protein
MFSGMLGEGWLLHRQTDAIPESPQEPAQEHTVTMYSGGCIPGVQYLLQSATALSLAVLGLHYRPEYIRLGSI